MRYNNNRIAYSKVIYAATADPISLQEAKTHLRVDHDDEDALINILKQAATEMAELHTGRSFCTQTRVMKFDNFPSGDICIQNGPLISISGTDTASSPNTLGITYYDDDEVLQTLSASEYWVDSSSNIARIIFKDSWPSTYDMPNAVIVTYTAGYGDPITVPGAIRQAILLILGHLYENRESVSVEQMYEMPFGSKALLGQYVVEQSVIY